MRAVCSYWMLVYALASDVRRQATGQVTNNSKFALENVLSFTKALLIHEIWLDQRFLISRHILTPFVLLLATMMYHHASQANKKPAT